MDRRIALLFLQRRIPVAFFALGKVKWHLVVEIAIKLRSFPERLYTQPSFR
jgi:hypothetical protein